MPHDHPHPHNRPLSDVELRVKALESILTEKELIDPEAIDLIARIARRRVPGGIRTMGALGMSVSPRCASARGTRLSFQAP